MGRQLIWVTDGPCAGDFMEVDDADADEAEAEGWGQKTLGRDGMEMRKAGKRRHQAAEAYLDRRAGYENRELRSAPAPAPSKLEEDVKKRNAGGRRPSTTP